MTSKLIPFKANTLNEPVEPVWAPIEDDGEWGYWPVCPSCDAILDSVELGSCPHCGQQFIAVFPDDA